MSTPFDKRSPVVIGGIGGSGTRVVAEICQRLGIYLGRNLNDSLDNLWYTALFKRSDLFTSKKKDNQIRKGLDILTHAMIGGDLHADDFHRLVIDYTNDIRQDAYFEDEFTDYFGTMPNFIKDIAGSAKPNAESFIGWGWKEPNSHLLIEYLANYFTDLRYIHVQRNGLDMAYSDNQIQVTLWGAMYGIKYRRDSHDPAASFRYWVEANKKAINLGKKLLPNNFLALQLERICSSPDTEINRIAEFLELPLSKAAIERIAAIPKMPKTVGRHKNQDMSWLTRSDIEALRALGYAD
jgi:hypothetical protein